MSGPEARGAAQNPGATIERARRQRGRVVRSETALRTVSSTARRLVATVDRMAGDRPRLRRVAVVTDEASLGQAAVAALRSIAAQAPDLRQQTEMRIRHCAEPAASVRDFVDLTQACSTRSLTAAIDALADDPGCDAVLVALGAVDREVAARMVGVVERMTRNHPDTPVAVACPAALHLTARHLPDGASPRPPTRH